MRKLVLFSFSKNMALALPQFFFSFWCIFSGQMLFYDFLFTMFNSTFTSLPILMVAFYDQDHTDAELLERPELYACGRENQGFGWRTFGAWLLLGTWTAAVVYEAGVDVGHLAGVGADGRDMGLWVWCVLCWLCDRYTYLLVLCSGCVSPRAQFNSLCALFFSTIPHSGFSCSHLAFSSGTAIYAFLLFAVTIHVALIVDTWRPIIFAAMFVGPVAFFPFMMIYSGLPLMFPAGQHVAQTLFSLPLFWVTLPWAVVVAILPLWVVRGMQAQAYLLLEGASYQGPVTTGTIP
jgi:magnesium-transporting ATPase (P-type)